MFHSRYYSGYIREAINPYIKIRSQNTFYSSKDGKWLKTVYDGRKGTNEITDINIIEELRNMYNIDEKKLHKLISRAYANYTQIDASFNFSKIVRSALKKFTGEDRLLLRKIGGLVHIRDDNRVWYLPETNSLKFFVNEVSATESKKFFRNMSLGAALRIVLPARHQKQIEHMVHYITAQVQSLDIEYKIVEGNQISYWYHPARHHDSYVLGTGDLATSCMMEEECQPYVKFYDETPEIIKMFILVVDNLLVGRTLLWHLEDGNYYDRIYACPQNQAKMRKHLEEMGYKNVYSSDEDLKLIALVNWPSRDRFPYMDSFRYCTEEKGKAKLGTYRFPEYDYYLDSTQGNYSSHDDNQDEDYYDEDDPTYTSYLQVTATGEQLGSTLTNNDHPVPEENMLPIGTRLYWMEDYYHVTWEIRLGTLDVPAYVAILDTLKKYRDVEFTDEIVEEINSMLPENLRYMRNYSASIKYYHLLTLLNYAFGELSRYGIDNEDLPEGCRVDLTQYQPNPYETY